MVLDDLDKLPKKKDGAISGCLKINCQCNKCNKVFKRAYSNIITSQWPGYYCSYCSAQVRMINYNKNQTGKHWVISKNSKYKTIEEKKKAFSERLSKRRRTGDLKNCTWSNYNKKNKGKTFEQIYGEEKGKQLREKLSKSFSGKKILCMENLLHKGLEMVGQVGIKIFILGVYWNLVL